MNAERTLPTGTVPFLFTDIEGPTLMVQARGERWIDVLAAQRRVLRLAITANDRDAYAKKESRPGNSPRKVTAALGFVCHDFNDGIKSGLGYRNPAKGLERKPPNKKLLRLPNRSQFAAVVAYIRSQPGWGRIAGDLVEGLAYSGMRAGEWRRLRGA